MNLLPVAGILAKFDMPLGTSLTILVCSAIVCGLCLMGTFAAQKTLTSWAAVIGTNSPLVARVLCLIGVLLGGLGVASALAAIMGFLD